MSSTFTWLDQSDDERRKVLDVIDLFKLSRPRFTGHFCGERDDHATSA
jgi:hypothetical protein